MTACRYCERPCSTGDAHPCCTRWADRIGDHLPCPACAAAAAYWREKPKGRQPRWARQWDARSKVRREAS